MSALLQLSSALAQSPNGYCVASGDSQVASKTGVWNGWPIVNMAVDGSKTADVLANQIPQLSAPILSPQLVLFYLNVGINDITAILEGTLTLDQFRANASAIGAAILATSINPSLVVITSTVPAVGSTDPNLPVGNSTNAAYFALTEQVAGYWRIVCQECGFQYLDLFGYFTEGLYALANLNTSYYLGISQAGNGHYGPAGWQTVDGLVADLIPNQGPMALSPLRWFQY